MGCQFHSIVTSPLGKQCSLLSWREAGLAAGPMWTLEEKKTSDSAKD